MDQQPQGVPPTSAAPEPLQTPKPEGGSGGSMKWLLIVLVIVIIAGGVYFLFLAK